MHMNMVYKKAERLACGFTGLGDSGCLVQINKSKLLDCEHTHPVHKSMSPTTDIGIYTYTYTICTYQYISVTCDFIYDLGPTAH